MQHSVKTQLKIGSVLQVRRKLWTWPAFEDSLRQLFGPSATARDHHQRDGLLLIARSHPETVIVMPTGSGKTVLFMAPALLPHAEVTVVITPLVALKQDLMRRCQQWNISFAPYSSFLTVDQLHAVPSLLFVDVEQIKGSRFLALLKGLYQRGRLDRLVLDEAHLVLTASHYRHELGQLAVLQQFHCPFVCMTATLPPHAETELKSSLALGMPQVLRVSSD